MAHYAVIDDNNLVINVITGKDEDYSETDWEKYYSELLNLKVLRTSYNTVGGKHLNGKIPFRKNYASIGYYYDPQRDAFIPPRPFPSWILDEETCLWAAPVSYPDDGKYYDWDEQALTWVEIIAGSF